MAIPYSYSQGETTGTITAIIDGEVKTVTQEHPNWDDIRDMILFQSDYGDTLKDELLTLLDPGAGVQTFFQKVSERVSVSNGHVYLDGDEVNDDLASNIVGYVKEGQDPMAYVNFLEKVSANPNDHSREQLFRWLSKHDFAITPEGNFLAYKGVVNRSPEQDNWTKYPFQSSSRGTAIVDGQVYTGAIPNGIGAVVEMPRSEVQHDPSVGCHTGLHAGTWDYASTFTSGPCLLVEINPRDVVSVPTDCGDAKIRTCRYVVREVVDNKLNTRYVGDQVFGFLTDMYEDEDEDEDDNYYDEVEEDDLW